MRRIECTEGLEVEEIDTNLFQIRRVYTVVKNNSEITTRNNIGKYDREGLHQFLKFYQSAQKIDIKEFIG